MGFQLCSILVLFIFLVLIDICVPDLGLLGITFYALHPIGDFLASFVVLRLQSAAMVSRFFFRKVTYVSLATLLVLAVIIIWLRWNFWLKNPCRTSNRMSIAFDLYTLHFFFSRIDICVPDFSLFFSYWLLKEPWSHLIFLDRVLYLIVFITGPGTVLNQH